MTAKHGVTKTMVFIELKSGSDKWEGSVFYDIEKSHVKVKEDEKFKNFESKVLGKENTEVEITIFTGTGDPIHAECDIKEIKKEEEK